jgi:hypothetical protein
MSMQNQVNSNDKFLFEEIQWKNVRACNGKQNN